MTPCAVRVIKLGGSLLDWPLLPAYFRQWIAAQSQLTNVMVVGGGKIVDALRKIDEVHQLDTAHTLTPEALHWLAIQAMGITATLASHLLPDATIISAREQIDRASFNPQIMLIEHYLRADRVGRRSLPCGWDVTSDSIAASLAVDLNAAELVLLKSRLPVEPASVENWARQNFVDRHFARALGTVKVRAVNLRGAGFPEVTLPVG